MKYLLVSKDNINFTETHVADNHRKCITHIPEETGSKMYTNKTEYKLNKRNNNNIIKSVKTAPNSIDLRLSNGNYGKELTVSKSQNLNTNILDIQLQDDILEWFQDHSNKLKIKMWDKKLKKIAERLQIPGEEEKLKIKIENYLKRVPSQFSECDEDRKEFRQQLPKLFIRKLKKFYLRPEEVNPISVYHVKVPKCYDRNENDLRNIIKMWLKGIYFKKRDCLGKLIERNDMLEFVNKKLRLFMKDCQSNAEEYETSLKCEIGDIIKDLPILFGSNNTKDFVSRQTDKLVNELLKCDIIKIRNKTKDEDLSFENREKHDQPSSKEIKDFVIHEITNFLHKSHVGISTNRVARLETDLTDILLDATDSLEDDIGCKFKDEVYVVLKNVGKLSNSQAKQFTSSLFKDFQNILKRKNEKSILFKSLFNLNNSGTYLVYQVQGQIENADNNDTVNPDTRRVTESDFNANKKQYTMAIVNQIQEWLANIEITTSQDKGFLQVAVQDLAGDIVDRYKYLELNPGTRGSDDEELEYLKYQIYKWIYHLIGDDTDIVQYAPELMQRIQNSFVSFFSKPQETPELPNQLTNTPLKEEEEQQPFIDPKQEKLRIRRYEDIIDDWIDKVPQPKKSESIFTNTRNEHVHELAVNINKIKHKIDNVTPDEVANKLKSAVLEWIKTLPLHPQASKSSNRDDIVDNLVQRIQQCNIDEYVLREKKTNRQHPASQSNDPPPSSNPNTDIVRDVITDWSRNLPLKPVYCPREFSSLIDRMAVEITRLLAHPKYSIVAENGKEIMRTIFLYLREFPFKTEIQVHENLSKMAYLLWRHFIDMDLCRDDSGNSSSNMFVRRRNIQTYNSPLNFLPQRSDPDPNTSQVAGPSCKNVSCRETAATENQNPYSGSYGPPKVNANQVRQLRNFGPSGSGGSMSEYRPNVLTNRRMSYPNNLKSGPITNEKPLLGAENEYQETKNKNQVDLIMDYSDIPQDMQLEELLSYYNAIFKELCEQLPFPKNTVESEVVSLRKVMYTCIKTMFEAISADDVIGNDNAYAEYVLEQRINELLKQFPPAHEVKNAREAWMSKVIAHVMNAISYIHTLTDTSSFRLQLQLGFKRQFAREMIQKDSERILQNVIAIIMDKFLRNSEFKEDDVLKANSYRRKLIDLLESYFRRVATRYKNNFNKMDLVKLEELGLKYLNQVTKPDSQILDDEANEILLNEEIKKWYQALPLVPMETPIYWQRDIELLSKKIYSLEKKFGAASLENEIKHEVSVFLEKHGKLKKNEDLNINPMVDDLINILKNMETKPTMIGGYESFEGQNPPCSSFTQSDPRAQLAVQQTGLPYQPCTGRNSVVASSPCSIAVVPTSQAISSSSHSAGSSALPNQPCLSQTQPTAGQQLTGTCHASGPSTIPYQPCLGQVQPSVGQQLTVESGTQIPQSCRRSVINRIGGTQAPPGNPRGQTTPSTARVISTGPVEAQRPRNAEEESEDTDERRRRCRCKYRSRWKRRCYFPDNDDYDDRDPRCYPMSMPYPYRYYY